GCWNEDYNCQDCFVLSESSAENENECTVFFDNDLEELEPVDELIDPDGLNILYQRVSFSIPCPGFTPFFVQGSEPPEEVTTYLKETYTRSKVSGCTDPTDGLFGRTTTTYAVASRERCVAEEGWTHYAPSNTDLVDSDQEPLHTWSIREFEDGDNTVKFRYDTELSEAYSTDDFIRDASDMMPDFQVGFSQVGNSVSAVGIGLTADSYEGWISYSKVRFKFEWGGDVDESEKTPKTYHILFQPQDDPDTEDVDESEDIEILSEVIEWDGSSGTVFELDPEVLKPDMEGTFLLLEARFETFDDDESREIGGSRSPNWKVHKLNLDTKQDEETHYEGYEKCVAHIWSNQPLNLAKYLSGYESNQEAFENPDVLNWRVDGQLQDSYLLNLETNAPNENRVKRYNIEVVLKGSSEPIDQLVVSVVPPETLTNFDQWLVDNQDLDWLDTLPAVYSHVLLDANLDAINPEPSSLPCNNWKDNKPFSMFFDMNADTFYHPDADYEIRSEETSEGHGHQACYNEAGLLIRSGVSAGTADRSFYGDISGSDSHVNLDAIPFVWAVQLDGTPAQGEDGIFPDYSRMDNPIMHEGRSVGEYIELRPPIANDRAELISGDCP
ncbi:hypothetical protein, partial [Puniceicoccus vermicola]|uniref:hypothetical protein n=1 Tax=Puniceicoccus vermicola TaxID=388746 RepID=UPI00163955E3